jgi:hypothetical protein
MSKPCQLIDNRHISALYLAYQEYFCPIFNTDTDLPHQLVSLRRKEQVTEWQQNSEEEIF